MSLQTQQEYFVTQKFLGLEKDLKGKATKPYRETSNIIIATIQKVFEKYNNSPDTFKYLLIQQELERLRVFTQIKQQYGAMGLEYSNWLKGFLKDNFNETVTQSNDLIGNTEDEYKLPDYIEPKAVEELKKKGLLHGIEMVALLYLLLHKKRSFAEITIQIELKTVKQTYDAKRVARTETASMMNTTSLAIWQQSGVDKVKWTDATESIQFVNSTGKKKVTRVCKYCRGYATGGDGGNGIYSIGKLPSLCPAHPNCRCTLVPVLKKPTKK